MWQKIDKNPTTKYHLVVRNVDGNILAACGQLMREKRDLQVQYWSDVFYGRECMLCREIYGIVYTSVEDAMTTIRKEEKLTVIHGALAVARLNPNGKATLIRILESRERVLEKAGRR